MLTLPSQYVSLSKSLFISISLTGNLGVIVISLPAGNPQIELCNVAGITVAVE
jgi:hypothetical protein